MDLFTDRARELPRPGLRGVRGQSPQRDGPVRARHHRNAQRYQFVSSFYFQNYLNKLQHL